MPISRMFSINGVIYCRVNGGIKECGILLELVISHARRYDLTSITGVVYVTYYRDYVTWHARRSINRALLFYF